MYDGSSEKYPILETVCNSAPNGTVKSTFNKMFVVNTFKGFLAKYRKVKKKVLIYVSIYEFKKAHT